MSTRGAQIPNAGSWWHANFLQWCLTLVHHQCGTCLLLPVCCLEFRDFSENIGKSVHPWLFISLYILKKHDLSACSYRQSDEFMKTGVMILNDF